jgi:hypothetical protein
LETKKPKFTAFSHSGRLHRDFSQIENDAIKQLNSNRLCQR